MHNGKVNWRFLFVITLFWFAHYVFAPYFSPYLAALDYSASTIGVIVGTYGLSQLILRTPLGIAADKLRNHKLFMVIGFCGLMAAGGMLFFASSPAVFTVARFFSGVSASTWVNFSVSYTGMFTGDAAGKAVGHVMASNNLGRSLSFVFGMVFFDRLGISGMFLTSILVAGAGFLVLLTIPRADQSSTAPMRLSDVPMVLRDRNLILFSLICALVQLVIFATTQSFTTNYARELGASGAQLGLLSLLFSGCSILGSLALSTNLRGKLSDRTLLLSAFACMAAYCTIVPNSTTIGGVYIGQMLCGIGGSTVLGMTMDLATKTTDPAHKSTAMGVYQSVYGLGMTFGPIVMGVILDHSGSYTASFYSMAAMSLVGLVWCGFAVRPRQNPPHGKGDLSKS